MADLSFAAQAIKDAVLALYSDEKAHKFGWQLDAPTVAAALRAAADQVVPNDDTPVEESLAKLIDLDAEPLSDEEIAVLRMSIVCSQTRSATIRSELLAIAAELETSTAENR
jgi:hypothetical protein